MKIFFDTTRLGYSLTGIGNLTKETLLGLAENLDTCDTITISFKNKLVEGLVYNHKNIKVSKPISCLTKIPSPVGKVTLFERFAELNLLLPVDLIAGKFDWWIFPNFYKWRLRKNQKSITYIHDLVCVDRPQDTSLKVRKFLSNAIKNSVENSTAIVTISEFTKKRILDHYGISEEKISIIPPGYDEKFFTQVKADKRKSTISKYGLSDKNFILSVATLEPRKNLTGLIDAYLSLPKDVKQSLPLVLAGGIGWNDDELSKKILAATQNDNVKVLGYVDYADLPSLYSSALFLAFPSFYEGFGMPVIESLACKTPVLTSDQSAMPEAGGSGALYVDPSSIESIKSGMLKLISDANLQNKLVEDGFEHIQKFKWENSIKKLVQLLKDKK